MTRRSLSAWVLPGIALLLLGLVLGNVALLLTGMFVLITALLAAALPPPSDIVLERSLPRTTVWSGDTLSVDRRLVARVGIGLLFVHDVVPAEAQVASGSNLRMVWKWPGHREFDLSYVLRFPRRGQFVLASDGWESQSPFGVRSARGPTGEPFEVRVVPRIHGVTRLNEVRAVTRSRRNQDDLARTGALGTEFRELRPYQPGDPIKRINWKASARGSRSDNLPLVNELEPEARRAVWVFLDMAEYMDVGAALTNPLENTIEASGALAQYYLWKGSTLGAFAYNTSGGAGEMLPPDFGRKQFNQLMRLLTRLRRGPANQDLLQAVERCKDFLVRLRPEVFVITRLDVHYTRLGDTSDSLVRLRAAVSRLTALRARSRGSGRVRVVHVAPEELRDGSRTADLIKWETRLVAESLRGAGAAVLEWSPEAEDFSAVLARHIVPYA